LKEDIKQLGLSSNYRYFKKDRIVWNRIEH
jgi:hypothetical protein